MILFKCSVEVETHAVKKNSRDIAINRKTGRAFPKKDQKLIAAENYLIDAFRFAKIKQEPPLCVTLAIPVNLKTTFWYPRAKFFCQSADKAKGLPKGRRNSNVPDISNLYQIVEDCLQSAGIIQDDFWIESHDGSRRLPHDSDHYLLEVELTPVY